MMRRPPGETVANKLVLALVILLVPWLVDAQQQQKQAHSIQAFKPPNERLNPDAYTIEKRIEATRIARESQQVETPLATARRKNTLSSNDYHTLNLDDASAIAALAPADPAVRAPPIRRPTSQSGGLSSPQIARSLEDWEVEDFVLLATVDGKLYARDRKTGKERWTLEVDKPMIETIHHRRNRSMLEEDYRQIDEYLWVVEPSSDGRLFVYFGGGQTPGLVNTGLTMKKLVEEMSPYLDEDPPVVYTGSKTTTMVTLDARTGRVIKWFGPGGAGAPDPQSCQRPNGLADTEQDECSTRGTLTLGRTEYIVAIQSAKDSVEIATLKYSEWGPNNYDQDLHRQYRKSLDSKYVLSKHDGSIFAFDHTHPKEKSPIFKQKFSYPVARVFDVARPGGIENDDPELIVLPQPVPTLGDNGIDDMRDKRIFLNHTEDGSWYAMSGSSYPLITDGRGPERARCENIDYWQHGPLWEDLNDAQLSKALVGLHYIDVLRPGRLPTISGPLPSPEDPDNTTFGDDGGRTPESQPSLIRSISQLPSTATSSLLDFVNNPIMTIVLIGLLLLYNKELGKWFRSVYASKFQSSLKPAVAAELISEIPEIGPPPPVIDASEPVAMELKVPPKVVPGPELDSNEGPKDSSSPNGNEDPQGSQDVVDPAQPTPQRKKKTHRGQRGGAAHRKKKQNLSEDTMPDRAAASVEDAVRDAQKLGEPTRMEPDVQTLPNGVTEVSGPVIRLGSLEVNTERLIGTGSNGTMVFEGKFDGREVAVKRMLIQFFDIASQETKLLRESDDHQNVIRYFAQQQSAGFLYIALELCPASLADVIEKPHLHKELAQEGERDLPNVLYQITNGLQHLHNLRIVHRDLKPQNILVALGKNGKPRLLVSDFGLCKKLEGEQSSFRATTAHAAGTSGWRAPELLLDDDAREGPSVIDASTHSGSGSILVSSDIMSNRRATRAIDIFSLGLVFFYVLTNGSHPFDCGDRYMREVNIRKGTYNLRPLEVLGDFSFEAKDLIGSMLAQDPKRRPSAREVLAHPFFWSAKKRLNFLCDVSDHFEKEKRDPPTPALTTLESFAPEVTHGDFLKPLGKEFVESMGKQRKYTGTRLLDLLRALRNKKNHYEDMSEGLKKSVGPLPEGYLSFWTRRFPNLLTVCWNTVFEVEWEGTDRFREYYEPAGL